VVDEGAALEAASRVSRTIVEEGKETIITKFEGDYRRTK
jgi:hypothetical protein